MIALPIIQDQQQQKICEHCEDYIIGCQRGGHNSYHYHCEGSHCEEAEESFYEDHPERVDHYEFNYRPSKEVNEAEARLDEKIKLFEKKVKFKLTVMLFNLVTNIVKIKINSITNESI